VFFIGLFFLTAVINHTRPSAQKQSKQNRRFGGVSVKRRVGVEFRVGAGVGVGVEVGFRVSLLYRFFIPLTQIRISRNLHQLCIVTIFSDLKEIKKCGRTNFFASSQTVPSHFSQDSRI